MLWYCNSSCGNSLCPRGLLRGQDSFIWAEINIKWWPSSINPFVRPSNSSPERKAVVSLQEQEVEWQWKDGDVWTEVDWWMRKLLLLWERVPFIASCLSIVSSCFFYGSDYTADAWTNSSLRHPPHRHTHLPQQAEPPWVHLGHSAGKGRKSSAKVTFVKSATGPCLSLMWWTCCSASLLQGPVNKQKTCSDSRCYCVRLTWWFFLRSVKQGACARGGRNSKNSFSNIHISISVFSLTIKTFF